MNDTQDESSSSDQSVATRCADASLKLAEARAQIEDLIDANRRLRSELSEMTLMWVSAGRRIGHDPDDTVARMVRPLGRTAGEDPGDA